MTLNHLLLLFPAHALCDFPLQGDFLSKGKNPKTPIPGVPWGWCLFAHALIHAGAVGMITGSLDLAVLELAVHMLIDWLKCEGAFNLWRSPGFAFGFDQALHYGCKVAWIWWAVLFLGVR